VVFDEGLRLLTTSQVPAALDAMAGEPLTQFATTRLATADRFGRSLDAKIRDHQWDSNQAFFGIGAGAESHTSADPTRPEGSPILGVAMLAAGAMAAPGVGTHSSSDSWIRTWMEGSGVYGDVDGNSNESDFDYTIWGGSLGGDLLLAEHWVLGLAGGYANTDLDFSSRSGEGGIDTYQGALYAGYVDPRFHVGVSGRYAHNDMDGKRDIVFGAVNRSASADLDGEDYGARFESGINLFNIGGFVIQPIASVNYNHLEQDGYTESGAVSLNLAVDDFDLDSLVTGVGARVRGRWEIDQGLWIVPELHGRWLHEFLDTDRLIDARLVSAPVGASAFQIQGVELPRDSGSVGITWSVISDGAWSIAAGYDVILNEDLVQHVGSIALNFEW
jgi:outer membrane autotransporter protein